MNSLQKKDFLEKVFERLPLEANDEDLRRQLEDILRLDTNNGKLYKYRAFGEYSLKNYRDGTLYCASPREFNDPFDCRIGIDLEGILYSRYNISDELLEKHVSLNDKWMCELAGLLAKKDASVEEFKSFFVRNQNDIEEWISKLNDEEEWKAQVKDAFKCSMLIFEVMSVEQIKTFFGGAMGFSEYSSVWGINEDADKTTLISKLTQLFLPEKTDEAKTLDSDVTKLDSLFAEIINKMYRVGCLCTDYKNSLMWSHYANSHKGFCIEYDFLASTDWWENYLLLPVIYSKKRVKFPWNIVFVDEKKNEQIIKEATRTFFSSLLTKDEIWNYENEWRIIVPFEKENIKMPPISCIYVGALCSEENVICLKNIAQELNVPIKRMMIGREDYTLHATEIINNNDL